MIFKAKYPTQLYWASQKASTVLYATPFYNPKIFISNESVNLFWEDNFNLRKRLSLKKMGLQGL